MSETAIYLFCVARPSLPSKLAETGVDGRSPLFVRTFGERSAVVSFVSTDDFCGPAAAARMKDLSWLGPRAWRHEAVIEHVMAHSPVLPARFGTLFSSLGSLEGLLAKHDRTISQFLDSVTGQEEWGVRCLLDREKALRHVETRDEGDLSSLSPGMRYLHGRRARALAEKELSQWVEITCAAVIADLQGYASRFNMGKAMADSASNAAFLVPEKRRADFCMRVERASAELIDKGLTFGLTGPWPPYNFAPALTA